MKRRCIKCDRDTTCGSTGKTCAVEELGKEPSAFGPRHQLEVSERYLESSTDKVPFHLPLMK